MAEVQQKWATQKESEEEIRQLSSAVTQSIDGIAIGDLELKLIYVNNSFARIHGYSPEEMIGMSTKQLHNDEQMEEFKKRIREIKTKGAWKGEIGHIRKDGSSFPAYVSLTLLKDEKGKPTGILAICRDITKRKKAVEALRESEEKFRDLSENANDLIQRLDIDAKFIYVNRKWLEVLGYTRDEVKKLTLWDILRKDQISYRMELFEKIFNGEDVKRIETVFLSKSGKEIYVEGNVNAQFKDGKFVATRGIFRDITERKETEMLKNYSRQLEKSNRDLDDFTHIVSHDLKEPLRCIDAFSKFIVDDYKDKLDEGGKNYLTRIRANVTRMQNLIEDLLEISRIERKKKQFEEVAVEELINEAKLRLEYAIKQKNAQIIIRDKLPRIFCDRVRLTEVFVNLISNAIKFTEGKQPWIEIGCKQKDIFYEFYVKDNGPGIEKQYFDKIFGIFQRLCRREDYEGTGAGLSIVKRIVEMHKGKIWLESKIGEGTTFHFTILQKKK